MKTSHAILACDSVARTIANGTQTQHRVPVKAPQSALDAWEIDSINKAYDILEPADGLSEWGFLVAGDQGILGLKHPYGVPGHTMFVREAVRAEARDNRLVFHYRANGGLVDLDDMDFAAEYPDWNKACVYGGDLSDRWIPNIHMPEAVARTVRVIVRTWVERMMQISSEDVFAEGFDATCEYYDLMESLYPGCLKGDFFMWCVEWEKE